MSGNTIETKNGSVVVMTAKYDPCNHKETVTEPNSGTLNYTYDGYGQQLQYVDGNSKTFNMQYDVLGRLTQQSGADGTSTYSYNGAGVNGTNMISSISGFSGVTETYEYDSYGDVTNVTEGIHGNSYPTTNHYDGYGFRDYMVFPSGVQINYSHDSYDYLTSISEQGGPTLYTANTMNSYGQATSYTLGNGITSTLTTNYGVPINYATTSASIQNLSLTYDWTSGDLTQRQDNLGSSLYECLVLK